MSNTKIENLKNVNAEQLAEQFMEFVHQKPGFDTSNYGSSADFQSDYRVYKKDADFNRNLREWEVRNAFEMLTPEELAHRVFDNRLYVNEKGQLDYITGQYFPTEYQGAARHTFEKAKRIAALKAEGKW